MMKTKKINGILLLITFSFFVSYIYPHRFVADDINVESVAREQTNQNVKSLACEFQEIIYNPMLKSENIRFGKLYFIAPQKLKLEYDSQNFAILKDGRGVMVVNGVRNSMASRVFVIISETIISLLHNGQANDKNFKVINKDDKTYQVEEYIPINPRIKNFIERLEVKRIKNSGQVYSVASYSRKSSTTYIFENIKENITIDESIFN